jgi:hypothetical protein
MSNERPWQSSSVHLRALASIQSKKETAMKLRVLLTCIAVVLTATVATTSAQRAVATPSARGFTANIDNEWFPLRPGTRYVYTGERDGVRVRDFVIVSASTTTIGGYPARLVYDRAYMRGHVAERTTDYYTQDRSGNVWYVGEDTAELDANGRVTSTEGSWRAGTHGAKAGIFMPAHPKIGQSFRQEFYKGHAEDHFRVVGLFRGIGGQGAQALLTEEWTPLERGVLDHKTYVRGIGDIAENSVKGGNEHMELVSVQHG